VVLEMVGRFDEGTTRLIAELFVTLLLTINISKSTISRLRLPVPARRVSVSLEREARDLDSQCRLLELAYVA
jgi:hypothetical protein